MTRGTIAGWVLIHRWTGLVCTAFLLMLCVTGLPLIFHAELDDWISPAAPLPPVAAGTRPLSLDALLAQALRLHPGDVPLYMSFDEGRPVVNVTSAPRVDADVAAMHFHSFDRRSGAALPPRATGFTDWLLRLHTDMLLGLRGELFLGAMGLVFVAALVSGVVLYVPFMARLPFGAVRRQRGPRVRRLDRHNFLGVLAAGWMTVVALTGTLNTLATPLTQRWQDSQGALLHDPAPARSTRPVAGLDAALRRTLTVAPGMRPQFIAFPGAPYAGRRHAGIYLQGTTPLTRRLLRPVFVDGASGRIAAIGAMPWYMQALFLAQPLHFGDYAGWPMKLLWAALDLVAIAILWTGLRLWLDHKAPARSGVQRGGTSIDPGERRLAVRRSARDTLAWPAAFAALSVVGLSVSLAGDGLADAAGWIAMAVPLVWLAASAWRPQRRRPD